MYFNRRFGALGLFVLPTGMLSIYSGLYLVGYSIYIFIVRIIEKIISLSAIDFALTPPELSLFFLKTSALFFLVLIIVPLTLFLMALGKRIAKDKIISFDVLCYLSLYGFLAPIWVGKAVLNAALAHSMSWR